MIIRVGRAAAGAVSITAVITVSITGCTSSGPGTNQSSAGSGRASASTGAPTSGRGLRPADPVTTRAVGTAYARFFDSRTSPVDSQKFLQHGSAFGKVLEQQAQGGQAQHATAKVSSVLVTSADVVTVTFTISSGGKALLPDVSGFAVRENGTWLVAATTFCRLLKLQGQQVDACADPSITALPT